MSTLDLPRTARQDTARTPVPIGDVHHLRAAGVSLVVDYTEDLGFPGSSIGAPTWVTSSDCSAAEPGHGRRAERRVSNVPERAGHSRHRDRARHRMDGPARTDSATVSGKAWSTLFTVTGVATASDPDGTQRVVTSARDDALDCH